MPNKYLPYAMYSPDMSMYDIPQTQSLNIPAIIRLFHKQVAYLHINAQIILEINNQQIFSPY